MISSIKFDFGVSGNLIAVWVLQSGIRVLHVETLLFLTELASGKRKQGRQCGRIDIGQCCRKFSKAAMVSAWRVRALMSCRVVPPVSEKLSPG
jgi:hypothetical protein